MMEEKKEEKKKQNKARSEGRERAATATAIPIPPAPTRKAHNYINEQWGSHGVRTRWKKKYKEKKRTKR